MADPHPRVLALLDEAKENPEDDAPRLVLADWLQENGDTEADRALGEFLYVQCQLARGGPDAPFTELRSRERPLRDRFGQEWLGAWKDRARGWSWERGLLRLRLGELGWLKTELGQPAHFHFTDGLAVHLGYGDVGERALRELARSPVLAQLNHLDLDYNQLGSAGLKVLLNSPSLGRLTSLCLAQTGIGTEGTWALANCASLSRLTTLSLWGNRLDGNAVRFLAQSPHLGNLVRLDLRHNMEDIPDEDRDDLRARFGAGVLF